MDNATSRTKILNKIKQALQHSVPVPFPTQDAGTPVFQSSGKPLDLEFAEQFTQLQGKFIFCSRVEEMHQQLEQLIIQQNWKSIFCTESILVSLLNQQEKITTQNTDLSNCDASVTSCEALIARTGSIIMSATQALGRTASVYAPVHICIAYINQLVYDIKDALLLVQEKYGTNLPSLITFATGPSRTADIEKTLVVGVHGPKEVYVFLVHTQSPNS
jgi:L-lactate dehydrogenase complex protein LldG